MEYKLNTLVENGIIDPNKTVELICDGQVVWKGLSDDLAFIEENYEFVKFDNTESADFNKPDYKIIVTKSKTNAENVIESYIAKRDSWLTESELVGQYFAESRLPHSDSVDPEFGLPEEKKYPLFDKEHVLSAIKFFNYVSADKEKELAEAIIKKMAEYDISEKVVGEKNNLKKYFKTLKIA